MDHDSASVDDREQPVARKTKTVTRATAKELLHAIQRTADKLGKSSITVSWAHARQYPDAAMSVAEKMFK